MKRAETVESALIAQELLPIPLGWADWIVDDVADEHLRDLAKELLESAIHACNGGGLQNLVFTIHNWRATTEELGRSSEDIEAILKARDEVRKERARPVPKQPPPDLRELAARPVPKRPTPTSFTTITSSWGRKRKHGD